MKIKLPYLNFKEKIGDYSIIKQGDIIVSKDNRISFEISDEGDPLILRIEFVNQGGRTSSVSQEIDGNIQTLKIINFKEDNSINGLFEPAEIGTMYNNGNKCTLYFNFTVHTINSKEGNRIFKYSFLIKE